MNPFGAEKLAAGYANARPPVHPLVMRRARRHFEGALPFRVAVDVGCGAGLSTRALAGWAARRIGMEPAASMLGPARTVAPGADFIAGAAESMPFRDGSVDLIAAAGSLNYVRLDAFFDQAARALQTDGVILVYDFSPGRSFRENAALDVWFDEFLTRYPHTPSEARVLSPDILARADARFRLDFGEEFETAVALTHEFYVDYMMTETNVAAAMRRGVPYDDIRRWCADGLKPIWGGGAREVVFRGYVACLRR